MIAGVLRNSPADEAGIKPGDILLAVEGKSVMDSSEVLNLVAAIQPGQKVTLTLLRNNAERLVKVKIGKRPT